MTNQTNPATFAPPVRYKGVCTQETVSHVLNVPRTTLRDFWKRHGISLENGVSLDVLEKTHQHYIAQPSMDDFVDHCWFVGSVRTQ